MGTKKTQKRLSREASSFFLRLNILRNTQGGLRLAFMTILGLLGATASALAITYVVKTGDTLSTIAKRTVQGKTYGKKGALKKLIALNPDIKNPNFILPKQVILLSAEDVELSQESDLREHDVQATSTETSVREPVSVVETTPITAPTPSPELQPTGEDGDKQETTFRHSLVELSPLLYYSRIDGIDSANGSKASLISKTNYGLSLQWKQVLSPHFRVLESASLRHEEYLPDPSTAAAIIENTAQNLTSLGIGAEYDVTKNFTLLGSFHFSQELYYKGIVSSSGGIVLQAISIPRFEFGGHYRIWQGSPFHADIEGRGIFLLPSSNASYETKFGRGYLGKVSITQDFSDFSVRAGMFYQFLNQDSSILQVNRQDAGLEVGFVWRLGREEKAAATPPKNERPDSIDGSAK